MSDTTATADAAAQAAKDALANEDLVPGGIELFSSIMDVVGGEKLEPETPAGGAPADAAPAGDGQPAAAGEGADAATADAGASADGAEGKPAAAPADANAKPDAAAPAADGAAEGGVQGTADAAAVVAKFGELSTALETRTTDGFRETAITEVREKFPSYFDALSKAPRELIGAQVPKLSGEGMDTLRDSADAKDWQDSIKLALAREVEARVEKSLGENSGYLETLHQSIELFQNNADLIPGTAGFNQKLADRLTKLIKPYEVRVDGKLHGYSVPVQPLLNGLREELGKEAAPAATSPAAGAATTTTTDTPAAEDDRPQAGITSKAGNSGAAEEGFDTLFGTIGLSNIRI